MNILRKQRGKTQNLFLIECKLSKSMWEKEYSIMGSTGNVYNVIIKKEPECSCPDYQSRGNRCKHIYFTLIRIMKVTPTNEDKPVFTKIDLMSMFTNIPNVTNNLTVDDNYKKKYRNYIKNNFDPSTGIVQKSIDDLCPICLDDLGNGEKLDYCKYSCGKPIHELCFSMWAKFHPNNCIYCQKSWNKDENKYINLLS